MALRTLAGNNLDNLMVAEPVRSVWTAPDPFVLPDVAVCLRAFGADGQVNSALPPPAFLIAKLIVALAFVCNPMLFLGVAAP